MVDIARRQRNNSAIKVMQSLIFSDLRTVRQIFNIFYYLLSSIHPEIKKDYYSVPIIKNSQSTYKYCQEYFNILNKLLFTEDDDKYFQ